MTTPTPTSRRKKAAPRKTAASRADPGEPAGTEGTQDVAPVDGRTARAERTREAIVDALLGLLEEGDLQPPASRIAERAGISLRLIYHHFGDLESLFRAAATREGQRIAELSRPVDPALPLAERIDALVEERTRLLEFVTPVRRASLLQEPFSEELRAARDALNLLGADVTLGLFEQELAALAADRRAAVGDALVVALMWGTWNDLREMGRSVDEARAAVRELVRGLLGA